MRWHFFGLILSACLVSDALQTLTPGAQWTMTNQDYTQLTWLDKIQAEPSLAQVQAAQTACEANNVQLAAYQTELSTTVAAVSSAAPNYVAANATSQIQVNKNMARIIQLRSLLGLQ